MCFNKSSEIERVIFIIIMTLFFEVSNKFSSAKVLIDFRLKIQNFLTFSFLLDPAILWRKTWDFSTGLSASVRMVTTAYFENSCGNELITFLNSLKGTAFRRVSRRPVIAATNRSKINSFTSKYICVTVINCDFIVGR